MNRLGDFCLCVCVGGPLFAIAPFLIAGADAQHVFHGGGGIAGGLSRSSGVGPPPR
jgi:hypothetical protein